MPLLRDATLAMLSRARVLPHLNFAVDHEVSGRKFRIPVQDGLRALDGDLEPWMDITISRVMRARPGAFVDVGVNLGQTLMKLKALAPAAEYIGFEPNPRCACYVADLIAMNGLHGCRVYPFALGESPEVVQLFQKCAADAGASVVAGFRRESDYSSRQFVTVFPGDQVLRDIPRGDISTIKIDVEGAERDVLLGLAATVEAHRPFIICEVLPVYNLTDDIGKMRLSRQREIEAFLKSRDYQIHRVRPNGSLVSVAEFGIHSDLSACNYVFAPAERALPVG